MNIDHLRREGFNAHKARQPRQSCPHPKGSIEENEWLNGWTYRSMSQPYPEQEDYKLTTTTNMQAEA